MERTAIPSKISPEEMTTASATNQIAIPRLYRRKTGSAVIAMAIQSAPVTRDNNAARLTSVDLAAAFIRKPGGVVIAGPSNTKFVTGATNPCSEEQHADNSAGASWQLSSSAPGWMAD